MKNKIKTNPTKRNVQPKNKGRQTTADVFKATVNSVNPFPHLKYYMTKTIFNKNNISKP